MVKVLYKGLFNLEFIKNFKIDSNIQEGFVIRLYNEFMLKDFQKSVVKWVRKNHIQTDAHWMDKEIITNKLKCS